MDDTGYQDLINSDDFITIRWINGHLAVITDGSLVVLSEWAIIVICSLATLLLVAIVVREWSVAGALDRQDQRHREIIEAIQSRQSTSTRDIED